MDSAQRIAVVGSGITGLSAAWLLHRSGAKVTLFEAEEQCGGHTLTDTTSPWPVDLGFQVFNLTTYPHLVGFLEALGVDSEPSDMSFALSMDNGKLEWGSVGDLDTVFAQRSNLASPSFLRMVWEVLRFGREAPQVLEPANAHKYAAMTLGKYLDSNGYSSAFKVNYVLPMCAAVWSVPTNQVLAFPVQMLVRFWLNHHLLDVVQRPKWRVVKGRSRSYVQAVLAELPDVRTSTPIAALRRPANGAKGPVSLTTASGEVCEFDAVVLATHSDISLSILGKEATQDEREVLGAIPYAANDVYLHTDRALMPVTTKVWSSWNFLGSSASDGSEAVCVSYWLNRLQHLPASAPQMFVTLNPPQPPAPNTVIRRLSLAHPVYSQASVEAHERLPSIQGTGGVYFAGAWASYGFHEDGIKAGVAAAQLLGASIPWTPISTCPKIGFTEGCFFWLFDRFAKSAIVFGKLRLILPNGDEVCYGNGEQIEAPVPKGEEWRGLPCRRATVRVLSWAMFRKIVLRHDTGMGEAYMDGDFTVDNLGALLALVVANARELEGKRGLMGIANWVGDRLLNLAHLSRSNTIEGSRRNIEEHYDAGNAMYSVFLDKTMTYSAGIHSEGGTLEQAQHAKLDAIIAAAGITSAHHVLEVGCGWGSFAMRAASTTGCRVTGLTISKEQLAEATARVKAAGLEDRVKLLFCDYRDCPGAGTFDRLVSIEMIEAVGHEHLRTYFAMIGRMLAPGGKAVIQVIAQPDERYEAYCRGSDFIREHIFPGGHLPSMGAMVEAARGTGLAVHSVRDIGPDYAITLREWRAAWESHKKEVLQLNYSERFWRKYQFYFAYCEAAFDARYIHDFHVTWVKDAATAGADVAGATANGPSGLLAGEPGHIREAVVQELPSDPVNQVLLALYFFLAGLLMHRHPYLWLLPVTSTACAALHAAVHVASRLALPFYALLHPTAQAWWCADAVHLAYSVAATAAAAAYVCVQPSALTIAGSAAAPLHDAIPSMLTCASTGFYAFQLWVLVKHRLFATSRVALLQCTLLLFLFGVAAYKGVHIAFLSACLLTEAGSVALLTRRMAALAGAKRAGLLLASSEKVAFGVFRVGAHALITLHVLLSYSTFSNVVYWGLALAGMAFLNYNNYRKAQGVFSHKAHAA